MADAIVAEARNWIGTPYVHQASSCTQGTDCLGLIRGIWRNCIGPEPQATPNYSSDWGEVSAQEHMLMTAQKWFFEKPVCEGVAGDLVLFRWKNATTVKHAGILTSALSHNPKFIHAYEKAGVVETTLGSQWKGRIAACFSFPEKQHIGN